MNWAGASCGLWLLCGCKYANKPLNSVNRPLEARVKNRTRAALGASISPVSSALTPGIAPTTLPNPPTVRDDDGYFVGISISGGGSRSSVFAAACMFQLQQLGLLQKADYISAVSGGSLAAAYYCLSDKDWNPGEAQEKLTHSFARDMLLQMAQPWVFGTLMMTDLDRSDLLANSLRQHLFTR